MAAGDFVVRRNASNTDSIPNAGSDLLLLWDTAVDNEGTGITYSAGTFTLGETGHFLVMASDACDTTDTTTNTRQSPVMTFTLGGTELDEGRCTGYIRKSSGAQETVLTSMAIINVTSTTGTADELQVRVERYDTTTSDSPSRMTGNSGVAIVKLDDSWDYGRYTSSATTSGGTVDDTVTTMNLGTTTEEDATFTRTSNTIDVATNNLVLAVWTLRCTTEPTARAEFQGRLTLAGTAVPGSYNQTYLRGSGQEGCGAGGMCGAVLLEPTSGDDVELEIIHRETGENTQWEGDLQMVELPAAAKAIIVEATTGDFNTAATNFSWDTNPYIDTDTFTHTATNANLDVDTAGDYLAFASVVTTTNVSLTRATPTGFFRVNTTDITHARNWTYNRNTGTAEHAGLSVGTLLPGLAANDSVYFRNDRWADPTGAIPNTSGAMSLIEMASLFTATPHTDANAGSPSATATAYDASVEIGVDAGSASATATAADASPAIEVSAEAASATATAFDATVLIGKNIDAPTASASATAYDASVDVGPVAPTPTATATAYDASVAIAVSAPTATATAIAYDATHSTETSTNADAESASATATAYDADVDNDASVDAPTASATAIAYDAGVEIGVQPDAPTASATATAYDATASKAVSPAAPTSSATATAYNATVDAVESGASVDYHDTGDDNGASVTTLTVTWDGGTPANGEGMLLVLFENTGSTSGTVGTFDPDDTGFSTTATNSSVSRNATRLRGQTYGKIASGEGASEGLTNSETQTHIGSLGIVVNGSPKAVTEWTGHDYHDGGSSASSTNFTSNLAYADGDMVVIFVGSAAGSPGTFTAPTNWDLRNSYSVGTGGMGIATRTMSGSGTITAADMNMTWTGTGHFVAGAVLIPADSGNTNAPAESASVTATAYDATVEVSNTNADAESASATATAYDASVAIGINPFAADILLDESGDPILDEDGNHTFGENDVEGSPWVKATAYDATVSLVPSTNADAESASVTATAYDATVDTPGETNAPAESASVAVTAYDATVDATSNITVDAPTATATATAYDATVQTETGNDVEAPAESASVTATAYDATVAITVTTDTATATATAYDATADTYITPLHLGQLSVDVISQELSYEVLIPDLEAVVTSSPELSYEVAGSLSTDVLGSTLDVEVL